MSEALVSIIIPAHNSEKHIRETLLCALGQTWPHKEVIVVNNGSTDRTAQILAEFDDIIVIEPKCNSAAAARNIGLQAAKGSYIQFLDADDLLNPEKIAGQMSLLNGATDQLSLCRTVQFTDGDDHLSVPPDPNWFYKDHDDPVEFLMKLYAGEELMPGYGGFVTVHSWLTPKTLIDKAGPWNEELSTDDDGEFFCRVVLAARGIRFSDGCVNYYRKHRHQASLSGQRTLAGFKSSVLATDLKYQWLKAANKDKIIDHIFARFYWWTGISAYPKYKDISKHCIKKARQLGYKGAKYVGGRQGRIISLLLGWKVARLSSYYKHK